MKLTVLLLLLFSILTVTLQERSRRSGYTCGNNVATALADCMDNSRIRISKTGQDYNLRLCSNNDCADATEDMDLNWIRCRDICSACRTLLGDAGNCNMNQQCEDEVDMYLNSFCASAIPSMVTSATDSLTIVPSQCIQTTLTTTVSPTCTNTVPFATDDVTIPAPSMENASPVTAEVNNTPVIVLAALLCLSVILLAVVTGALVWTCRIMKKRERGKTSRMTIDGAKEDEDDVERYFKNPTYEGSANQNSTPAVTYYTVNTPYKKVIVNGHTYDVPDKDQRGRTLALGDANSQNSASETNIQMNNERNYYEVNKDFMDDH